MKLYLLGLLFLVGTVLATETIQINNQTFKLIPLGRVGSKLGVKTEVLKEFKLLSVPTENEEKNVNVDETNAATERPPHHEDSFDCEVRLPILSSGLSDLEELFNQVNNQKLVCKVAYINGDRYDGEVQRNLRHGNGQMVYANGEIYNGLWEEDAENGTGKLSIEVLQL